MFYLLMLFQYNLIFERISTQCFIIQSDGNKLVFPGFGRIFNGSYQLILSHKYDGALFDYCVSIRTKSE